MESEKRVMIEPFDCSRRSVYYGLYSESLDYTQHYNSLKFKYKQILTTWILATFIAFSYVLRGKEVDFQINKMFFIALIAIFSSRGILLIMFLDTAIYHRLLNASFSVNLEMEQEEICNSRTHVNMMKALLPHAISDNRSVKSKFKSFFRLLLIGKKEQGIDPVIYDGLPYLTCCLGLWFIAGISISRYFYSQNYFRLGIALDIIFPMISIVLFICLLRRILLSGIEKFKSAGDTIF